MDITQADYSISGFTIFKQGQVLKYLELHVKIELKRVWERVSNIQGMD